MYKHKYTRYWHQFEREKRLIYLDAPRPQYNVPENVQKKGKETKAEITEEEREIAARFFSDHRDEVVGTWNQIQHLEEGKEEKSAAFQQLASEYRSEVLDQLYLLEVEMNEENENYKQLQKKVENIMSGLRRLTQEKETPTPSDTEPIQQPSNQNVPADSGQVTIDAPYSPLLSPIDRKEARDDQPKMSPLTGSQIPRSHMSPDISSTGTTAEVLPKSKTEQLADMTPEEIDQLKEKHMELLRSLRAMPEDELLESITPQEIEKHEKEGTLYILFLAINSKDKGNLVEKSAVPEDMYKSIIDNVVSEGMELRKEIVKSKQMSASQLREKLESSPFSDYFKQENLPEVDIQLSRMSEEQLRALYESCLLEGQVRNANIRYTAGGSFWATALPETGYNIYRQGDCNTVANYYHSLASLAGSNSLSSSLKSIVVDGHAQICFDLGKDDRGKQITISKNTSHVDMSKVDSNGRWTGNNYPYVHNFYDVQHDMDDHGADQSKVIHGADALVAAQIGELRKGGSVSKSSNEELMHERKTAEKVLSLNPHDATENSNYISGLFVMIDRGLIPESEAKKQAGDALKNYIESSYWSGFPLINYARRFGRAETQKFTIQFENKVMSDPKGFSKFVRSSVNSMRNIPDFDRRLTGTESSVSLDIENRKNMLRSITTLLSSQRAKEICQAELDYLNQEMRNWKPVTS